MFSSFAIFACIPLLNPYDSVVKTNRLESSQASSHTAGENLRRRESTGVYYAFLKRKGNQFRRSLKTDARALAKLRLAEKLKDFDGLLSHDARSPTFKTVSERWLENSSHTIKESTSKRRKTCLKALTTFFRRLPPSDNPMAAPLASHYFAPLRGAATRRRQSPSPAPESLDEVTSIGAGIG